MERSCSMNAYRPLVEDGWGLFPEDFRVKAPKGFNRGKCELLLNESFTMPGHKPEHASSLLIRPRGSQIANHQRPGPMAMQMTI